MSHPGSTSVPPRHLICDVLCNGGMDEGPADRLATEIIDVLGLDEGSEQPTNPTPSEAVEAAAKRSYEYEGDRRGIRYIGWEDEPEKVREEWRASVRVPITAYMTHYGAPVDLREVSVAYIQPSLTSKHICQSSGAEARRDCSDAFRPDSGDPESSASVPNEPTPGPWAYEYIGDLPPGRTRSDRPTIAIVGDFRVVREGRGYDLHSSDEDDARLIAAAPATAAERDRLREHSAGLLSAIDQFEPDIDDYDDEVLFRDLVKPALERLRAALSCAKGGPARPSSASSATSLCSSPSLFSFP